MPDVSRYSADLADIAAEWNSAEEVIKQAEQVNGDVMIPAIKELRYAGRRLVDALDGITKNKDENEVRRLLSDARFNCFRSRHDAIDAALSKIAIDMASVVDNLGNKVVLEVLPEFAAARVRLIEAQEKIAGSRRNRDDRDSVYQSVMSVDWQQILADYTAFRKSQPIMQRLAAKESSVVKWSYFFGFVGIVSLLITAITADWSKAAGWIN